MSSFDTLEARWAEGDDAEWLRRWGVDHGHFVSDDAPLFMCGWLRLEDCELVN